MKILSGVTWMDRVSNKLIRNSRRSDLFGSTERDEEFRWLKHVGRESESLRPKRKFMDVVGRSNYLLW